MYNQLYHLGFSFAILILIVLPLNLYPFKFNAIYTYSLVLHNPNAEPFDYPSAPLNNLKFYNSTPIFLNS